MKTKSNLVIYFEKLLSDNLIPYMEVTDSQRKQYDIEIKVYFPKIIANICTLLNKHFTLKNRDDIVISRDKKGYHTVELSFLLEEKEIQLKVYSMLHDTWGVAKI